MSSRDPRLRSVSIEHYGVLGAPPSPDLDALAELAAQICDVPIGVITLLTETEQHHVATFGVDPSVCPVEDAFCHPVIDEPALSVADVSLDPRWSDSAFVTGAHAVRFYASAPLVTPDGVQVGRLCVFGNEPRELTEAQGRALEILADRVVDVLELRFRSRQLQDSLHELTGVRDELRRSNIALTRFAEQTSHDLRTPLTSMLANAELLLAEAPTDPAVDRIVGKILSSGRRMNELFDRNLTYARRGGRLHRADIDLADVFRRVVSDLDPRAPELSADITFESLPRVYGDAALLYQVALNLLTNAVKFHRPDVPPQVVVDAVRTRGHWRVRVRDNGIGIDPTMQERVFALYARETSGVNGFGIGLASSRRIVEAHGGRMGVEDVDGPGVVVWFELPDMVSELSAELEPA